MKRYLSLIVFTALTFLTLSTLSSCSRKTGCPAYEQVHSKRDKKGNPKNGGSSNLFPKKMRRNSGGH